MRLDIDIKGDDLRDILTFRRMITPLLIQALFWIGVVLVILAGIVLLIVGPGVLGRVIGVFTILLGPSGGPGLHGNFHRYLPHQRDPYRHPRQHDARVVPLLGRMRTAPALIRRTRA